MRINELIEKLLEKSIEFSLIWLGNDYCLEVILGNRDIVINILDMVKLGNLWSEIEECWS